MRRWLLIVFSLWMVWGLRAVSILNMPAFVDESLHILRAQIVFEFNDATASFLPGKVLTYYYLALFQPADHNGLWLSREAIALLAPLSAALCFALVKKLTRSYWAGLIVIWLYALSPFLLFFERLALTDPFAAVFALALTWKALHFADHPTPRRAVITGGLLGLAILAKLTALPLAAVPVLALIFLRATHESPLLLLKNHWRSLLICYTVCGLLLLPTIGYSIYQEAAQLENKQEVVTTNLFVPEGRSRLDQMAYNVETYASALAPMVNALLIVIALSIVLLLIYDTRNGLYLLAIIGLAWGFVVFTSAFPSTRYLALVFPLWLVIAVVGLWQITRDDVPFPVSVLGFGTGLGMGAVALILGGIYFGQLVDDPTKLAMGEQDRWEYFTNSSGGFGLRDAVPDILALPHDSEIRLAAFVGNCHSLRLYFPENHPVELSCPYFRFNETMIPDKVTEWSAAVKAAGSWYFLVEDLDIIPFEQITVEPHLIQTYERPDDGVRVWLYRVTPTEEGSHAWFQ